MALEDDLLATLVGAGISQNNALALTGLSKSAFHYRKKPRGRAPAPVPHQDRPHPARLTPAEYDTIAALLNESKVSVSETFYRHLDSGDYVASMSSFHRVARKEPIAMAQTRSRRRRPTAAPERAVPTLSATQPGQVVCGDISFLPGVYRGQRFALYLVIDLFSRTIVGFTVQDREDEILAADLISSVTKAHAGVLETVHSDNGAAMTSKRMQALLAGAGVTVSTIRPGVSNDNAQIESLLRTVKYGPVWPGAFADAAEAQMRFTRFAQAYNEEHYHSSLSGFDCVAGL